MGVLAGVFPKNYFQDEKATCRVTLLFESIIISVSLVQKAINVKLIFFDEDICEPVITPELMHSRIKNTYRNIDK